MKKIRKSITALLLTAAFCLGLGACGAGDEGFPGDDGGNTPLPTTVAVKTGSFATDTWGYSGSTAVQVAAPANTEIVMDGHTLLMDASRGVVSGAISTRVSYSSDLTTLSAAARSTAPANFICYVDIAMQPDRTDMGQARIALPALSVTVDVGAVAPGQTVTVYSYDAGKWSEAQTVQVNSSGKVIFSADKLTLWALFS